MRWRRERSRRLRTLRRASRTRWLEAIRRRAGTTTIPTVLVPVTLSFEAKKTAAGKPLDGRRGGCSACAALACVSNFVSVGRQDAVRRCDAAATFPKAEGLAHAAGQAGGEAAAITIPLGFGYVLTSKKSGKSFAVADIEFLQKEIFKQLPKQDGKLVIAMTHNATFYADGDATVCCSWGTHGVDYGDGQLVCARPRICMQRLRWSRTSDVQPLTQQLAEFINDPLHDPLFRGAQVEGARATVPSWMRPAAQGGCGGTGVGYTLLPAGAHQYQSEEQLSCFEAVCRGGAYHLQNVALLPWYTGAAEGGHLQLSGCEGAAGSAKPCPRRRTGRRVRSAEAHGRAEPVSGAPNGHKLIGYWAGYGGPGPPFRCAMCRRSGTSSWSRFLRRTGMRRKGPCSSVRRRVSTPRSSRPISRG